MDDRLSRSDHGRRRLGEYDRLLRKIRGGVQRSGAFLDVLDIIEADAENILPRPRDGREKRDIRLGARGTDRPSGCSAIQQIPQPGNRSEEHTSELQSLMRNSYAVFCLKKKTNNIQNKITCGPDERSQSSAERTMSHPTQKSK